MCVCFCLPLFTTEKHSRALLERLTSFLLVTLCIVHYSMSLNCSIVRISKIDFRLNTVCIVYIYLYGLKCTVFIYFIHIIYLYKDNIYFNIVIFENVMVVVLVQYFIYYIKLLFPILLFLSFYFILLISFDWALFIYPF